MQFTLPYFNAGIKRPLRQTLLKDLFSALGSLFGLFYVFYAGEYVIHFVCYSAQHLKTVLSLRLYGVLLLKTIDLLFLHGF